MNILFITYYYPPFNAIGAIRTGQTVKNLRQLGHTVRVLTVQDPPISNSLQLPELDLEKNTRYTPWINVNAPVIMALGGKKRVQNTGYQVSPKNALLSSIIQNFGNLYRNLFNFPDGQIGWFPWAYYEGARWIQESTPDVIFASHSPPTSLLIASLLAKRFSIPWVAELRDLWTSNHLYHYAPIRKMIETHLEQTCLSTASAIVTVSDPLTEIIRKTYPHTRAQTIINGIDGAPSKPIPKHAPDAPLSILYTGMIYPGKRDPSPLFHAISLLPPKEQKKVQVHFYGKYLGEVDQLAEKFSVTQQVVVHNPVSYKESVQLQHDADLLLLMIWLHPSSRGTFTGKIFEYLRTLRPILAIAPKDNVAARVVHERKRGLVAHKPEEIAAYLLERIHEKETTGHVAPLSPEPLHGLYRSDQVNQLATLFQTCIDHSTTE